MKQDDYFILSAELVSDTGCRQQIWRQYGGEGDYWGEGWHIVVYKWTDRQLHPYRCGTLADLCLMAFQEKRELYVHKVADLNHKDKNQPITLVIRPNFRSWFYLWRTNNLKYLKKS